MLTGPSPAAAGSLLPHPMHTSFTLLTHAGDGTVTASIRIFADDLAEVLGPEVKEASAPSNARVAARVSGYVADRVVIIDRSGRRIALAWCGAKRVGEQLWLCVAAPRIATLRGAMVMNRILLDHFRDQINIVQVQYDGRRHSMLFSRAEAPKRLP